MRFIKREGFHLFLKISRYINIEIGLKFLPFITPGKRGIIISALGAFSVLLKYAKLWAKQEAGA